MILNKEQLEAVATREGAWCVLAAPGAGKTTVLTERVKALLFANQPINEILALTFTTSAADEMQSRIGLSLNKSDRGGFRTFHSFGLKLIFAEKQYLNFKLADNPFASGNGNKILRDVIKQRFGRRLARKDMDELRNYISKAKRVGVKLPSTFQPEVLPISDIKKWHGAFKQYDERMKAEGQIDYDDMITLAVELLENPQIRLRNSYKWVLADEIQDTDANQWRILQLVSERDGNVFVVGDSCQALYQFRGAQPAHLDKFSEWFPGGQTKILPQNYRSSPQVVKFCQRLAPIKNDLTANMRTANPDGPEVEIINYLGNEDEAENVLAHIQTLPGKSAVLARTNSQIGLFETLATAQEIKFHLLGKSGFWKTPEIRNLMGLVHFVLGNDPAESYPQRMVLPQRNAIRSLPATEALNRVITAANLKELYADEDYEEKDNFALDNLNGATRIAQRFPNLEEFAAFAIRASKASRKSKSAISFGTVHSSKGLQWDNVFIIGFQEGKIPHEKGDIFEEKCIAYVAVSRAARVLQLSYSGQRSRFLSELDIEGVQV